MQAEVRGTFSELGFNGKIDRCRRARPRRCPTRSSTRSRPAARRRPRASSRTGTRRRATATTASTTSCATRARTGCTGAASTVRCARMTGWNWLGRSDDWRLAPEQYGGIGFHDDAITDCEWEPTLSWTVPAGHAQRRLRRARDGRRRRGPRRLLRAAGQADGEDPLPGADELVPGLRQRDDRAPRAGGPGDRRPHPDPVADRGGLLPGPGVRPLDLRPPLRRRGRLLLVVAPADPQPAAEVALVGHHDDVAVPARPVDHRLPRGQGLRLRRRHRPRPAPRGARAARSLRGGHHGLASRSTGRSRPWTPWRATSARAAGSCTWAATASTGSSRTARASPG